MRLRARHTRLRPIIVVWAVGSVVIGVGAWLALDHHHRHPRRQRQIATLAWSGYTWTVRAGSGNPGPCNWAPANVVVDTLGHLHLKITHTSRTWHCAEINSQATMGYGTYVFTVLSDLRHFDPSVVLGMFTYDPMGSSVGNSEIDIEVSKWAVPNNLNDVEYSIQPTISDPTHRQKALPLGGPPYFAKFVWARDHVTFSVTDASGNTHGFVGTNLPAPPAETTQTDINLWLVNGKAPARGEPVEVILTSFRYTPALRS